MHLFLAHFLLIGTASTRGATWQASTSCCQASDAPWGRVTATQKRRSSRVGRSTTNARTKTVGDRWSPLIYTWAQRPGATTRWSRSSGRSCNSSANNSGRTGASMQRQADTGRPPSVTTTNTGTSHWTTANITSAHLSTTPNRGTTTGSDGKNTCASLGCACSLPKPHLYRLDLRHPVS